MSNRIAAILLLLLSLLWLYQSFTLKVMFLSDPVGPKVIPMALAGLLFLLSVLLFFQSEPAVAWPAPGAWANVFVILLSFLIYGSLLAFLGFMLATSLETAFVSWRFGARFGLALLTGLGVSLALYILFVFILGISLPTGTLFGAR